MGWFKKVVKNVGKAVSNYTPIGGFGLFDSLRGHGDPNSPASSVAGSIGIQTPAARGAENRASDAAYAAADAAIRQAEYEEQAAKGMERNRVRRRRGQQSTILAGGEESLGTAGQGRTLLGG